MDVLSVTEHTPLLESLAITVMEPVSTLFRLVVNPSTFGVVSPSVKAQRITPAGDPCMRHSVAVTLAGLPARTWGTVSCPDTHLCPFSSISPDTNSCLINPIPCSSGLILSIGLQL